MGENPTPLFPVVRPGSKPSSLQLQFPPLRVVTEEEISDNDQLEGVYHFNGVNANGAPNYKRSLGVGTGAEKTDRYLYSADPPGRWYIGDGNTLESPVRLYTDLSPGQIVPPGFKVTADEEGFLGEHEGPEWLKHDGSNWVPIKIHIRLATQVTCGSLIKLQSVSTKDKLHAFPNMLHPKSQFKVVSGFANWDSTPNYKGGSERANNYWQVVDALDAHEWVSGGYDTCGPDSLGKPLLNRAIVRLKHAETGMWLHSGWHQGHEFTSPLTKQQEVSVAGNGTGDYDFGDNWIVDFSSGTDAYWVADSGVQLTHLNTKCHLSIDARYKYPARNGELSGQREVACVKEPSDQTKWRAAEGLYFPSEMYFEKDD